MSKSALKYLLLSIILIRVFSSCEDKNLVTGNGVLKGKISIGPICPVERIPPDPACLPTMETYKAWSIAVWTVNKKSQVAVLSPILDGTFQTELPAGNYIIDFADGRSPSVGKSNLPALISVALKDTTILNINIDTGIR